MVVLTKEETIAKVNLRKEKIQEITKDFTADKARVAVVIDCSGSMYNLYANGTVQNTIERLLPIAMKFDDNGEMEVWLFDNKFKRLPNINIDNCYNYITRNVDMRNMGRTYYTPVIKDVIKRYMKEEKGDDPIYVIFLTDGDCSDKDDCEKELRKASSLPIFWQFVGIGKYGDFKFLQGLDDMKGRVVDNADFFSLDSLELVSDDYLYKKLLNEYPEWLKVRPDVNKTGLLSRLFGKK